MIYPTIRLVFDRKKVSTKKTDANAKEGLVQIEVKYNKKNKYVSTGVKLYSNEWSNNQVVNRGDSHQLNTQIAKIVKSIRDFSNEIIEQCGVFTFEAFSSFVDGEQSSNKSFIEFVESRIKAKYTKENTQKSHYGIVNALKEFGKIKLFSDITKKNIVLFDDYVKTKVYTQSSVYNYHKRLKTHIREAHYMGLIRENPYVGFKLSKGEQGASVKYLTEEELNSVEEAIINDASTNNARDCFLFCAYTGLAYIDLKKFDFYKDVIQRNGKYFIEDVRQKTGTSYKIQILSKAYAILEKHNFVLPVVSNQKYNIALKVVSSCAKLNKPLTSHMARHTFAVFALNNGVRIEVVSKMLAHTDIKTTQIYAKIMQKEVEEGFDLLEEKLK